MGRKQAYTRLAKQLGLAADDAHIGEFDVAQCGRVVGFANDLTGASWQLLSNNPLTYTLRFYSCLPP